MSGVLDPRRDQTFEEGAQEFVRNDLVDGGRSLQAKGRMSGGMKLHLSPLESRHEAMLRILVTQVASLTTRVRELELAAGVGVGAMDSVGAASTASSEPSAGAASPAGETGDPREDAERAERSGADSAQGGKDG